MSPLILQGVTLGERQKHFNALIKKAVKANTLPELTAINVEDQVIDNFLKIDIACHFKNVDYVLHVFKCEDALLVSRAIKKSTWLITDKQYDYIVNPQYLYDHLFPQMITNARNKLLLQIKIHLKDETRASNFFKYYDESRQDNLALNWLPYCSLDIIMDAIPKYKVQIRNNTKLVKRLCEKSMFIFGLLNENETWVDKPCMDFVQSWYIKKDTEGFLDMVETFDQWNFPHFVKKHTKILMRVCPERVKNKFDVYCNSINLGVFARHLILNNCNIIEFLIKSIENHKVRSWFSHHDRLEPLFDQMPNEGKFQFLKNTFIDKIHENCNNTDNIEPESLHTMKALYSLVENDCFGIKPLNIYLWVYKYASFDTAFADLTKKIKDEPSPHERMKILLVILSHLRDVADIHNLLNYYRNEQINEPFRFKNQFVNSLLKMKLFRKNIRLINEDTWGILCDIFCSMDVYNMQSQYKVQKIVEFIILHRRTNRRYIPVAAKKKFEFITFQKYFRYITRAGKRFIYCFLRDYLMGKIEECNGVPSSGQLECNRLLELIKQFMIVLRDYDLSLIQHEHILATVRRLITVNTTNKLNLDFVPLYNVKKSWRKHFIEESLAMQPTEETCINILKHNPSLFTSRTGELENVLLNSKFLPKKLLSKIKIYFNDTFAQQWASLCLQKIKSDDNVALIEILFLLLPRENLIRILQEYVPKDGKIKWNYHHEHVLSLQQTIAKRIHLICPPLSCDVIFWYARGDYLQYLLPSLSVLFYNLSPSRTQDYLLKLLNAPNASLRKHGVYLAFMKLNSKQILEIMPAIWILCTNSSIKAIIFKHIFNLLCHETQSDMCERIWEVMERNIERLSSDENTAIYKILGDVHKVPDKIQARWCIKCYNVLNSLTPSSRYRMSLKNVAEYTEKIMVDMEPDFISSLLINYINSEYINLEHSVTRYTVNIYPVMSAYLLCSQDEETQIKRFHQVFIPFWKASFSLWLVTKNDSLYYKFSTETLLFQLTKDLYLRVIKKQMSIPCKLFEHISIAINELPKAQNYKLLRYWSFATSFVKSLTAYEETLSECSKEDKYEQVCQMCVSDFTETILQLLNEDLQSYDPSIVVSFENVLSLVIKDIELPSIAVWELREHLLDKTNMIYAYLVVINSLVMASDKDKFKEKVLEIHRIIRSHPSEIVQMHYNLKFDGLSGDDFDNELVIEIIKNKT